MDKTLFIRTTITEGPGSPESPPRDGLTICRAVSMVDVREGALGKVQLARLVSDDIAGNLLTEFCRLE